MIKEKFKKIIDFFKNPNLIVLCVNWALTLICIAGSITLVSLNIEGVISIIVYVVSALSLAYSIYTAVLFAPTLQERFNKAIQSNKFTKNLTEDYSFRTMLFATVSLIINLGFVAFNIVFAVMFRSIWYSATATYYFLLSVLKGYVFYADKKAKRLAENNENSYYVSQLKNYRNCGIFLFILEIAMTAVVTLTVMQNKPMGSSDIMAITIAAYTFYKVIFAIINVVKARQHKNPQIQSIRNIGLVDAAITLVSLQMTLVATFSTTGNDMTILNAITGFVACVLTICIGIFMIVFATIKIKKSDELTEDKKMDNNL